MASPRICIAHGTGDRVALHVDHAGTGATRAGFQELEFHRCGPPVDADVLNPRCIALGLNRDDGWTGITVLKGKPPLFVGVADGRFPPQISPRTAVALGTGEPAASTTRPETDRPFFRIVTLSRFRDATTSLLRKCGCVAWTTIAPSPRPRSNRQRP